MENLRLVQRKIVHIRQTRRSQSRLVSIAHVYTLHIMASLYNCRYMRSCFFTLSNLNGRTSAAFTKLYYPDYGKNIQNMVEKYNTIQTMVKIYKVYCKQLYKNVHISFDKLNIQKYMNHITYKM